MYHKVSLDKSDGLTISTDKLEQQFAYLKQNKFQTYHCADLVGLSTMGKGNHVQITFDDGYVNQLELAYPLLQKYNLKATFFIPLKYLGKSDEWNSPSEPIMSSEQLNSLDPSIVELAYHSYAHNWYPKLTSEEIENDTKMAFEATNKESLQLQKSLAYPYGKYPKMEPLKTEFFDQLKSNGFDYGYRIGNRINSFPFKNPYEIQRIDVKGEFSLKKFKRKLKFGKLF